MLLPLGPDGTERGRRPTGAASRGTAREACDTTVVAHAPRRAIGRIGAAGFGSDLTEWHVGAHVPARAVVGQAPGLASLSIASSSAPSQCKRHDVVSVCCLNGKRAARCAHVLAGDNWTYFPETRPPSGLIMNDRPLPGCARSRATRRNAMPNVERRRHRGCGRPARFRQPPDATASGVGRSHSSRRLWSHSVRGRRSDRWTHLRRDPPPLPVVPSASASPRTPETA